MGTYIILLSGGSGKRLWPLSNDIRSKQFLRVLDDGSGGRESMVQRVYRQLRIEFPNEKVVVATAAAQREQIEAQLGGGVDIVCEPARRDTFPAIALSCTYLHDSCGATEHDIVLVLPVDVYAEQHYFTVAAQMCDSVARDAAALVLMGIAPTHPSNRFGYMVPTVGSDDRIDRFVEKPSGDVAASLIGQGALWNGGVFAFTLGHLLGIIHARMGRLTFDRFLADYATTEKISFDYAVVEKTESLAMVKYVGMWRDLGTWDSLIGEIGPAGIGTHFASGTKGTIVVNELDIPVVAIGTEALVIAASPDGILVGDREAIVNLKPLVDGFDDAPRFVEHVWGTERVVDRTTTGTEVKIVHILPNRERTVECPSGQEIRMLVIEGKGSAEGKVISPGDEMVVTSAQGVQLSGGNGLHIVETLLVV